MIRVHYCELLGDGTIEHSYIDYNVTDTSDAKNMFTKTYDMTTHEIMGYEIVG